MPRVKLLERLERERQRPLTLISVPAGYGKSILASMWLEASGLPGGWVSLDDSDNDLRSFVSYLLAAIETAVSYTPEQTQDQLNAFALPPAATLALTLLADLEPLDIPFLLVSPGFAFSGLIAIVIIFGLRAAAIYWNLTMPGWLTTKVES